MKELPTIKREALEHTELVKYAGASGDFNPIHTVSHQAKALGYPDVLTHGMFVMGFGSKVILEEWFPNHQLKHYGVRFMAPTYPGEALTVLGSVEGEKGTVTITNGDEEVKLKGNFEVGK